MQNQYQDIKFTISAAQIRGARAMLGWSAHDLARKAGLSLPTIQRVEKEFGLKRSRTATLMKILHALEQAGVEFIGRPGDAPGIRLRGESDR